MQNFFSRNFERRKSAVRNLITSFPENLPIHKGTIDPEPLIRIFFTGLKDVFAEVRLTLMISLRSIFELSGKVTEVENQ